MEQGVLALGRALPPSSKRKAGRWAAPRPDCPLTWSQVRFNIRTKSVELRTSKHTESTAAIQKGADFVQAFAYGFDVDDAIALLRMDSLYIQTFEIKDIRTLSTLQRCRGYSLALALTVCKTRKRTPEPLAESRARMER